MTSSPIAPSVTSDGTIRGLNSSYAVVVVSCCQIDQLSLCLWLSVNQQGVCVEKKREGRCSGVYFGNVCAKRICKRLSIFGM